jgi:hypothetical protein
MQYRNVKKFIHIDWMSRGLNSVFCVTELRQFQFDWKELSYECYNT